VVYLPRAVALVKVRYYTDPACPWSWNNEPTLRKLMVEFGDSLSWTYVMGGLAREYVPEQAASADPVYLRLVTHWLDVAERGGMPSDPRLWTEGPIRSTYPACMAVKAASEQAEDAECAYLRALREGLFCFRRKLDTTEALVEEARRVRLDVERFRIDLASNAIVEAFGADLEDFRATELELPSMVFSGDSGEPVVVAGLQPFEAYREAALSAGAAAVDGTPPSVLEALRRFGRMAGKEVEAVCGLPGPRAEAELWRLATEWQVRPVQVAGGELWEPA
jgi:predicted DsbA family dithiol-disulfide isomerase